MCVCSTCANIDIGTCPLPQILRTCLSMYVMYLHVLIYIECLCVSWCEYACEFDHTCHMPYFWLKLTRPEVQSISRSHTSWCWGLPCRCLYIKFYGWPWFGEVVVESRASHPPGSMLDHLGPGGRNFPQASAEAQATQRTNSTHPTWRGLWSSPQKWGCRGCGVETAVSSADKAVGLTFSTSRSPSLLSPGPTVWQGRH